jgi:hypothetical protein
MEGYLAEETPSHEGGDKGVAGASDMEGNPQQGWNPFLGFLEHGVGFG